MKKAMMVIVAGVLLFAGAGWADAGGKFTELQGIVTVQKSNGQSVQAILGLQVFAGDVVSTGPDGRATILFDNGSVIRLASSTTIRINQVVDDKEKGVVKTVLDVATGAVMNIVGSIFGEEGSEYKVHTPTSVSGVRGSINIIRVGIDPRTGRLTTLAVSINGTTYLFAPGGRGGSVELPPGTMGMVDDSGIPRFLGAISVEELAALLAMFEAEPRSVNERAGGLRNLQGTNSSITGERWYQVPDFLEPWGERRDDEDDPEDMMQNFDNPSNLIFQEPPQTVELIITITMPE